MDIATAKGGNSSAERQKGLRILIFSRDSLFARIARLKLESWGHKVYVEESLSAALQWPRLVPIRMAIIDLDMPDGGQALCAELKSETGQGYVYKLCYGSKSEREHAYEALKAGADAFARKPLHPGELRLRIEQASRLLALEDALAQGAATDPLTGLLKRTSFERFAAILFAQYRRSHNNGVLVSIGIDNLGEIAATHGRAAAEALERAMADLLRSRHRASDMIGRMEEGRFCLLLSGTTSLAIGRDARILSGFEGFTPRIEGLALTPRISVALTDFPGSLSSAEEALAPPSAAPALKAGR